MITLTREEAQQVLDAMEYHVAQTRPITRTQETIEILRARLAQPEPKPVAWRYTIGQSMSVSIKQLNIIYSTENGGTRIDNGEPLYTAPPQREWRELVLADVWDAEDQCDHSIDEDGYVHLEDNEQFARAIEAKLKEKNT